MKYKAAIIGAGPIGIETASVLKNSGISYIQFEKGPIGATLTKWPRHTQFFSSPEWIAISGIPIQSVAQDMITAEAYLAYLRQVIEILDLKINSYEEITEIRGHRGCFRLTSSTPGGENYYEVENVILATGDMNAPRFLRIPGEDLPHVTHYWQDPHLYFQKNLLIVGGRNSAVEAALRCWRAGVKVTISYRGKELDSNRLISRLHLEISLLIKNGQIRFLPETELTSIEPVRVKLKGPEGRINDYPADFVYLATGFEMDFSLYTMLGVNLSGGKPMLNSQTMETNVPGVFVAGTASAGNQYKGYKVFITTCHDHGVKIARTIKPGLNEKDMASWVGNYSYRDYPLSSKDVE